MWNPWRRAPKESVKCPKEIADKPKRVIETPTKKINVYEYMQVLEITFIDGGKFSQRVSPYDSKKPSIYPFKSFVRWYFGRPESPAFLSVSDNSIRMLRRTDIRGFSIKTEPSATMVYHK